MNGHFALGSQIRSRRKYVSVSGCVLCPVFALSSTVCLSLTLSNLITQLHYPQPAPPLNRLAPSARSFCGPTVPKRRGILPLCITLSQLSIPTPLSTALSSQAPVSPPPTPQDRFAPPAPWLAWSYLARRDEVAHTRLRRGCKQQRIHRRAEMPAKNRQIVARVHVPQTNVLRKENNEKNGEEAEGAGED